MRIWLIQVGETLPIDGPRPRLQRIGLLANILAARGHHVVWWCTTFRHSDKSFRFSQDTRIALSANLELRLIHTPGYKRNISLARLLDHIKLAKKFSTLAAPEPKPDVIHCGFPTIELSVEAGRYGRRLGVPVILDIRDMWPEVFLGIVPKKLKALGRLLLAPLYRQAKVAFGLATAISGQSPGFRDYGLKLINRPVASVDQYFPFAYQPLAASTEELRQARQFWESVGVTKDGGVFTVCFFGTMGVHPNFSLDPVIEAARIADKAGQPIRFVFCGVGPALDKFKARATGLTNVVFAGWVDSTRIHTLMELSNVGLLPYTPGDDFVHAIPNKAPEYLSAGLPILTSLTKGYLCDLLTEKKCGFFYDSQSPTELAALLENISRDALDLSIKAKNARALFDEQFRSDRVYQALADYIESFARGQ